MPAKTVQLRSYTGIIERVVVAQAGRIIEICTLEEYRSATEEGRAPVTVGFRLADIVTPGIDPGVEAKYKGQYESVEHG